MNRPTIKTVEVLQIGAGMAAALRWAIALMPLDGVRFGLSDKPLFEGASFVMSLMFAIVEIGATAYIMRAWRAEDDKRTKSALMALWTVALVLMVVAQVPPILANVNAAPMTDYPFWFQALWATCGVSIAFVIIGGVGYAEKSLEQRDYKHYDSATDDDCHCPICLSVVNMPVWLSEKHGDKCIAYCDKCKRAYTKAEVIWFPERLRPSSEALKDWQPVTLTPKAAPVTTPSDDKPHDDKPLAPLTDHFVRSVWLAKKANAPFADIADDAKACLNGTSEALAGWLANGKQSMSELAALLGVSDESRNVFDATCRGLRKPTGAEIARK